MSCKFIFRILLLVFLTPSLAIAPRALLQASIYECSYLEQNSALLSYDSIMTLVRELENGELEKRCTEADLEKINHLLIFLSRQGALLDKEKSDLERDIQDLLGASYERMKYDRLENEYHPIPAVLYEEEKPILFSSWFGQKWSQTKKFIKKNKKAVIIGTAIVASAAIVVGVVAAASAGAAATASSLSTAEKKNKKREALKNKNVPGALSPSENVIVTIQETNELKETIDHHVSLFKECILEEQFFQTKDLDFSMEENGKILSQIFAYQSLDTMNSAPQFLQETSKSVQTTEKQIDRTFSQNNIDYFPQKTEIDFRENVYLLRGEHAFKLHYYDQAISDFGKAIELNPSNHETYLERATAHLKIGEYERSIEDYEQYISKKPTSMEHILDFSLGFTKGLPKGIYESGTQLLSFASDCMIHPIDTAEEVGKAFIFLGKLLYSEEWETISQTLAPEVYELVTEWDTLSPEKQGELSGYAFGKYGSDIFVPGATAKFLSKRSKGAKELTTVCKTFKNAEKTLTFETLTQSTKKLGTLTSGVNILDEIIMHTDKLAEAGKVIDRGGLTKAGRGLMKHGYREGSFFPKPNGNAAQINAHGQKILELILNHPERKIITITKKQYGPIMDIIVPNLGGARFTINGEKFIGFLEP